MNPLLQGLLVAIAYLAGSVSSAVLVCRLWGLPDPRSDGSGNPGATNVLRIGGKAPAALTLAGDFLKGYLPVLAVVMLSENSWLWSLVMLAAFLGHLYPVFFGFAGGKGVATGFGVLFGLSAWLGVASGLTWLTAAAATRYSSLAALTTALLTPVYVWWLKQDAILVGATILLGTLQFWRHRANIRSLIAGTERRLGERTTNRQ